MARVKDVLVLSGSTVYRISKSKYVSFLENRSSGGSDTLESFGGKVVLVTDVSLPLSAADATSYLSALRSSSVSGSSVAA